MSIVVIYYKCLRTGREATHARGFYWPHWLEVAP